MVGWGRTVQAGVVGLEACPGKVLAGAEGDLLPAVAGVLNGAHVVLPGEDEEAAVGRVPVVAAAVDVVAVHGAERVHIGPETVGVVVARFYAVFDERQADRLTEGVVRG